MVEMGYRVIKRFGSKYDKGYNQKATKEFSTKEEAYREAKKLDKQRHPHVKFAKATVTKTNDRGFRI